MKKRFKLLVVAIAVLFSASSVAQIAVALHGEEQVTFYYTSSGFSDAVAAASEGDTIYIPGGIFPVYNLEINKKLHVFGVGHSPNVNSSTGRTQINGNIVFTNGADFGSISGLFVNGNVSIGSTNANQTVSNITIHRCHINGTLKLTHDGDPAKMGSNITLTQNIIGALNGQMIRNSLIRQNVIGRLFYFSDNNLFVNNIIQRTSEYFSWGYSGINGSTFRNNIFVSVMYTNLETGGYNNCKFHCNVFVPDVNLGSSNSSDTYPNLFNQLVESVFVGYDGVVAFSYDYNFWLNDDFAGKNFGTDGTDVGIFGTVTPFKADFLPVIPYIKSHSISTDSDVDGKIEVIIEVEAQQY